MKRPSPVRFMPDGFSLIEVMVASAVLAVVLTILLGTLTTSMSLWRNTEGKAAADREGRAAEFLIARELGNAVMPPGRTNLWPRVIDFGDGPVLQFLTTRPLEAQDQDLDAGDVCYIEYFASEDGNALLRRFNGSAWTYDNVLSGANPSLPAVSVNDGSEPQILATNMLDDARDAVRGLVVYNEANPTNFVILVTNEPSQPNEMLPYDDTDYNVSNPPVAVEINFAFAEQEAVLNKDLLRDENYKLRNAGFYSLRVSLPKVRPQ